MQRRLGTVATKRPIAHGERRLRLRRSNSEGGKLSVRRRKLQGDGDRDCNLRRKNIPEYDSLTVKTLLTCSMKGVKGGLVPPATEDAWAKENFGQ